MNREAVYEQLKIDEGVVYEIYNDHLGYPTFGVGHLIVEDDEETEPVGTAVTEEESGRVSLVTLTLPKEVRSIRRRVFRLWPDEVSKSWLI